jgi:site-specific recombinase XerD
MKVQEVLINEKIRYMLIDDNSKPVVPVVKFLKYLDNIGKADNTLKSYCHHLKLFFQFLSQIQKSYKDVTIDLLAEFISWLRNPHQHASVIQINKTKAKRSEKTVNTILTCVLSFYGYLMKLEDYEVYAIVS